MSITNRRYHRPAPRRNHRWIATNDIQKTTDQIVLAAGVPVRSLIRLNIDSIPVGANDPSGGDGAAYRRGELHHRHQRRHQLSDGYVGADSSLAANSYLKSSIGRIIVGSRSVVDSTKFGNTFGFTGLGPVISAWLLNRRQSTLGYRNNGIILSLQQKRIESLSGDDDDRSYRLLWPERIRSGPPPIPHYHLLGPG